MKTRKDNDKRLSEHFMLSEFTRSATAMRMNIDNTPSETAVDNLQALCEHVLEPLRRRFGVIRITSGYRSARLNRAVGGVRNSQHLTGQAADLHVGSRESGQKMFLYIVRKLEFDQLLFEHNANNTARWLHVSFRKDGANRRQHSANYVARLTRRRPWM